MPELDNSHQLRSPRHADAKIDALLSQPPVGDFFDKNESFRDQLETLAKAVADYAEPSRAMMKLFPRVKSDKKIKIFVSYKLSESKTVKKVVAAVQGLSDKIEVRWVHDAVSGKKWRAFIVEHIAEANWLILLLTDPDADWDWCLFECGRFEANMVDCDRLICIHHHDSPPPVQLNEYKSVPAVQEHVEKLLNDLCRDSETIPAVGPISVNADIAKAALEIVEAFDARRVAEALTERHWVRRVNFVFPGNAAPEKDSIPDTVRLTTEGAENANTIRQLFGIAEQETNWEAVRTNFIEQGAEKQWVKELANAIYAASHSRDHGPIRGRLTAKNGETYRPVLYSTEQKNGRAVRFEVVFAVISEAADAPWANDGVVRDCYLLFNMMRIGNHFRWITIKPALISLAKVHPTREDRKRNVYEPLLENINYVVEWAGRHGFLQREEVLRVFEEPDQQKIEAIWDEWDKQFEILQKAIEADEITNVRDALKVMRDLNEKWGPIAARRYAELVDRQNQGPDYRAVQVNAHVSPD